MKLLKSKTFWTAIVAILSGIVAFATQEITFSEFFVIFVGGLGTIFLRSTIDQKLHAFFGRWKFWTSKTFWAGIVTVLTAAGAYIGGQMELMTFLITAFTAIAGIFIRSAVNTGEPT